MSQKQHNKKGTPKKEITSADLVIIDAHALAYRAYYALIQQNFRNLDQTPTWAVYGFFRMLFKILNDYKPKYIAITWDSIEKTFRHQIYQEYKSHRKPMPEDLIYQVEMIKDFLKKIGFPIILVNGFEADDIIATLVEKFKSKYYILLFTGDKDCFQLLDSNVKMLRGKKGVSEFVEFTVEILKDEYGILPEQVVDYMALVGDESDNVPGAKGIGPKIASELIQKYSTIENIYEHLDELKPSIREKLMQSKSDVFLSKELVKLNKNISEINHITEEELKVPNYLSHEVLSLFRKEGFQQIYKDLLKEFEKEKSKPSIPADDLFSFWEPSTKKTQKFQKDEVSYYFISNEEELKKHIEKIQTYSQLVIDAETSSLDPFDAKLVGISLCGEEKESYYISIIEGDSLFSEKGIPLDVAKYYLQKLMDRPIQWIGQNIKFDYKVLYHKGIVLPEIHFDTMLASYLSNPTIRQHNLDDLAMEYLNYETIKYKEIAGEGKKQKTLDKIDPEKVYLYSCEDADITFRLYKIFQQKLKENQLEKIFYEVEVPLVEVLSVMELYGVKIDTDYLRFLSNEYELKIQNLIKMIYNEAGVEFNINSTKELQTILFEKMKLPVQRKTKTGFSTDQSVLESLRYLHPMIEYLLQYRKLVKLKNTYIDVLPQLINPKTKRIHTHFSQTSTATGRLSSSNPNLQNIPIKEEEGRAIRKAFIPEKGYKIVSLDYSQIELRILAHYSEDERLIQAFERGDDIHLNTAQYLFGVSREQITSDMRSKAKTLNFSIIYGATPYGVSQNLGIEPEEAKELIEKFHKSFPGVQRYMNKVIEFAEKFGYVETLLGRRRYIPNITSQNKKLKEAAQRIAINTPIQGTSADIIKLAMIQIHKELKRKKFQSKLVLQVHDELVFEAKEEEIEDLIAMAKNHMENAIKLKVPLKVDVGIGDNWAEAH
ncbi:MAG: DNA polymerase I [Leptospiraceae bacterium]|nr:DNA polymerase I [Leptospiraceae bacterium]MDW7975234.1 DNA polymerase I [Leptospiraceae bacterium]